MKKIIKNNFKKLTQKKGVSLIVLIVTIIVVIILAATVILTISKNNPIESAKEAIFKEDMRTFQDELNMVILKQYVDKQGQRDEKITASKYTKGGEKDSVYTYLSSFTKKYENKIAIKEGALVYVGSDEKEKQWLVNSGIYMAKKITVHYKDGYGNNLKESEECAILDVEYRFEAPDIEGYIPLNEVEEGIASNDIEITFKYCAICNDLAFIGLDSSGNETTVEENIVAYTVSGMGECNNPYVAIPREHNGKKVTQIKRGAFCNNNIIKSVIIPNTVEKVNDIAFNNANNLEYVKLNAKNVNPFATFSSTNLKKVDIEENVEYIGDTVFGGCVNLSDVTLYSEKVNLNAYIFNGCTSLTEVKVNEENNSFKSVDGVVYSKDGTILYMYPSAKSSTTYDIPAEVRKIHINAFCENMYLEKIHIPNTVEEINNNAFARCYKLQYINLDAKKVHSCFGQNKNLTKLEIGPNVEFIAGLAFYYCTMLTDVTVYSEKVALNAYIFNNCTSLTEVKVNEENNAFKSVDGVVYSKDGTIIYIYPIGKQGETYELLSETKEIAGASFYGNKYLKDMNIPSTVEEIHNYAFASCDNLENVKTNAKIIRYSAFSAATNLKELEIGENIEMIEGSAFFGAKNLSSINYLGTIEMWNKVYKYSGWNSNTSITKIICTDGTVTL